MVRLRLLGLAAVAAVPAVGQAQITGFGGTGVGWTAATPPFPNFTPSASADVLRITQQGIGNTATGFWYNTRQDYSQGFSASFRYQFTGTATPADGITFTLHNDFSVDNGGGGLNGVTGSGGGGLGYVGITNTAAMKLNIYNPGTGTPNSRGVNLVYNGGAGARAPNNATNYQQGNGVDLANANTTSGSFAPVDVLVAFDPSLANNQFSVQLTQSGNTFSTAVNLTLAQLTAAVQGNRLDSLAYVGFTGGTGGLNATQEIRNFVFVPAPPSPVPEPVGVLAVAVAGLAGWRLRRPRPA